MVEIIGTIVGLAGRTAAGGKYIMILMALFISQPSRVVIEWAGSNDAGGAFSDPRFTARE